MDEVRLIPLKKIVGDKGSVFHIIRDPEFDIKEVYLSTVKKHSVKGWKKHINMSLSLVVVQGNVKFTVKKDAMTGQYTIGEDNYCRLEVQPGCWVCFEGLNDENMIINCADLGHDPEEVILRSFGGYDENF